MDLNHPLLLTDQAPPPFPANYPLLSRLDNSVVCQICKEFYRGPVSISCGHSFCSECIQSFMNITKKCPICHEVCSEGSIRRNRALEEITDAWEGARPTMITLSQPVLSMSLRKQPGPRPSSRASSSTSNTKRPRLHSRSPVKSEGDGIIDLVNSDGVESTVEGPEEDDPEALEAGTLELTEEDDANCPICSAQLPIASIPMHIERGCPPPKPKLGGLNGATGNQKADWKRVFAGTGGGGKGKELEMKRIKKPNYALSTPVDLRNILSTYSLPTNGDKNILQHRLQEWIILFNSNLDTSHPRSLSALRAQLVAAENARKRDQERGKDDEVEALRTKEGLAKYDKEKRGEFERLRKEIMARDKKRASETQGGKAKENAIEVD